VPLIDTNINDGLIRRILNMLLCDTPTMLFVESRSLLLHGCGGGGGAHVTMAAQRDCAPIGKSGFTHSLTFGAAIPSKATVSFFNVLRIRVFILN
jgi:hypothetical protein